MRRLVLLCIVLLAGAMPSAANAGTNGQQLSIAACQVHEVWVSGHNQNGVPIPQHDFILNSGAGHCATTPLTGWWWKGPVTITMFSTNACLGMRTITVPTVYPYNYYPVNLF